MDLSGEERARLQAVVGGLGYDGSVSARAQMVLWDADGYGKAVIADMAGCSVPTVYKWLDRYAEGGVEALENRVSTGRPREVTGEVRSRILALTRQGPPAESGLSHWSSREMAKHLGRCEGIDVSHNFIAQLWRDNGLAPHRVGSFKVPSDPEFAAKVTDIVGLYLDPPDGAVVLSLDEKTQVQALDRTQPVLPISFGRTEKRTHDYVRHGTTNLFGAMEVATGRVTGQCFPRRRTTEFLKFMNRVVADHGTDRQIHVILDNLSTHNNPDVDKWLAKHPNVTFHFTPKGSSWINMIENWFGILERQSVHRGTFSSVRHLIVTITDYIDHWNQDAEPLEWNATAEEIIDKVAILDRDFKKLLANNI